MDGDFLGQIFFNNTVLEYLTVIGNFTLGTIIIMLFKRIYSQRLQVWASKTKTNVDDFFVNFFKRFVFPLMYFGLFYICLRQLSLVPVIRKGLDVIGLLFAIIIGVKLILAVLEYSVDHYVTKVKIIDSSKQQVISIIIKVIKFVVWSLAIIIILDNFGIKLSALITGLGIGGVAVALASQTLLGDVFNYFTIFFDRPFAIGDFIIIDEYSGTVEHIGIKTTRIRSLGGEQLVFSNTDLTNSRVRNYKRMERRRISFQFGVTYDTPVEKLEVIPGLVKQLIEKAGNTVFDRAHFMKYGEYSLIFEVVYYVLSSDYISYADIQHQFNLNLMREFKARNINFAIPTQNLYLHQ